MQLQKFGFEIRKINDTKNLYEDVDKILSNYEIKSGEINGQVQQQTVAHSLHKMLKSDRWICVTTIRQCAKVCDIIIPKERMTAYEAIHCVHWNEMLPKFRTMVVAMILDDFRDVLNPKIVGNVEN